MRDDQRGVPFITVFSESGFTSYYRTGKIWGPMGGFWLFVTERYAVGYFMQLFFKRRAGLHTFL